MINNKRGKAIAIFLLIFILIVCALSNLNSKTSVEKTNNKITKSVENDIPSIIKKSNSDLVGNKVTDNNEIDRRYSNVDKSTLTYVTTVENPSKDYFYEFKNGLAFHTKENGSLKPINNKKYVQILLGYSYSYIQVEKSLPKKESLEKIHLVLPDDIKKVETKYYKNYETILYTSKTGNFLVCLGYKLEYDENKNIKNIDKNNLGYISYFKEI